MLGGINLKNLLSAGLSAMPVNSDGVPFDMSHIYASGNIAADMTANVAAESTGRVLATRLYNMTNDPGMKDILSYGRWMARGNSCRSPCSRWVRSRIWDRQSRTVALRPNKSDAVEGSSKRFFVPSREQWAEVAVPKFIWDCSPPPTSPGRP